MNNNCLEIDSRSSEPHKFLDWPFKGTHFLKPRSVSELTHIVKFMNPSYSENWGSRLLSGRGIK